MRVEARSVEALLIDEYSPRFNTKVERKYLGVARSIPEPQELFVAELIPNFRRNRARRAA